MHLNSFFPFNITYHFHGYVCLSSKNLVCTSYSRQSSQYDCSTAVKAPQGHKTDGANKTEEHDLCRHPTYWINNFPRKPTHTSHIKKNWWIWNFVMFLGPRGGLVGWSLPNRSSNLSDDAHCTLRSGPVMVWCWGYIETDGNCEWWPPWSASRHIGRDWANAVRTIQLGVGVIHET